MASGKAVSVKDSGEGEAEDNFSHQKRDVKTKHFQASHVWEKERGSVSEHVRLQVLTSHFLPLRQIWGCCQTSPQVSREGCRVRGRWHRSRARHSVKVGASGHREVLGAVEA